MLNQIDERLSTSSEFIRDRQRSTGAPASKSQKRTSMMIWPVCIEMGSETSTASFLHLASTWNFG